MTETELARFAQGAKDIERARIVAWLRAMRRGETDPWQQAADAIERGEHLPKPYAY